MRTGIKPVLPVIAVCMGVVWCAGCDQPPRFATSSSSHVDPYLAGKEAAQQAISALGDVPVKGLIYSLYYPRDKNRVFGDATYVPDIKAEVLVAKGVAEVAGNIQNIGIRARPMIPGLKITEPSVLVLAMGGDNLFCRAVAIPILDDRMKTGRLLGGMMSRVRDLRLIFTMSEMRLNFEPFEGIRPDDFIRGLQQAIHDKTVILGGNGMNNPKRIQGEGLEGAQFFNGKKLEGYLVAMGIGGDISVTQGRTHEFIPSRETLEVTEAANKWVISLDDKPAGDVYRKIRGMNSKSKLTSDWLHPLAIELPGGELYLDMILNWVDAFERDKDARIPGLPRGSLRVSSVLEPGTKVRVLSGGNSGSAIVESARQCVMESIQKAGGTPILLMASSCCMRGTRLRAYRRHELDEVRDGVLVAMKDHPFPVFGFYSFGAIGPLGGDYKGLSTRFQQNMFMSVIISTGK